MGRERGENEHLLGSLPVQRTFRLSHVRGCEGVRGMALGLRLTPLARVINGLVRLQEKVPPARGEEKVDALNVYVFQQSALQPW